MKQHDLSALKYLFLAGEPLDEPTARWAADSLGVAIVDNYWQTETRLADPLGAAGRRGHAAQVRQPVVPGLRLRRAAAARRHRRGGGHRREGRAGDRAAAAAGLHDAPCGATTSASSRRTSRISASKLAYSTFDWATRDDDGYYFVLGRTDDVINVAGHRLGTREIEEAVQAHAGHRRGRGGRRRRSGQGADAGRVRRRQGCRRRWRPRTARRECASEVMDTVDRELGAIARPGAVHFVTLLPKTRSGKLLRRSIQALAEGRDPGRPHDDRGSGRAGADPVRARPARGIIAALGVHRQRSDMSDLSATTAAIADVAAAPSRPAHAPLARRDARRRGRQRAHGLGRGRRSRRPAAVRRRRSRAS